MTPLSAVAQVTKKSAQLLTATLYDASLGEAVKQAIEDSGMNLNPQVDGDVVSIPIPKLDKSSREALGKQAKKVAEAAKQVTGPHKTPSTPHKPRVHTPYAPHAR